MAPCRRPCAANCRFCAVTPTDRAGFRDRNRVEGKNSVKASARIARTSWADRLRADAEGESMPPTSPPEKMLFQLTLRRRGISDQAVLRAMEEIPREAFVEPSDSDIAYSDSAIGIACGQTISHPFVVAYMTEQLQLQKSHRVLEIGAGSGYQAAVLSKLTREVLTVERYRKLADTARARLEKLGCHNVEVMLGDGLDLPANIGPFDRIIVTAAMEQVPDNLIGRLEVGGVLIAPVGPHQGVQTLLRPSRTETGSERRELVDVRFVPA